MIRTFTFSARYRRHIESGLAIDLARVCVDQRRRADDDDVIRRLAPIPDAQVDADESGDCVLIVLSAHAAEIFAANLIAEDAPVLALTGT